MNQGNINENAILLADSHHGIYIPKLIAEEIISGNIKVKNREEILSALAELGNPENEFYWEAWEELCDNAVLLGKTGEEFYIYQDDDVWAIPSKEAPYIEEW